MSRNCLERLEGVDGEHKCLLIKPHDGDFHLCNCGFSWSNMIKRTIDYDKLLMAPCAWCGYDGPNYWQMGRHEHSCPFWHIGSEVDRKSFVAANHEDLPPEAYLRDCITLEGDTIKLKPSDYKSNGPYNIGGIPARQAQANDTQVGGRHYNKLGEFQVWDAWWHWNLNPFQAVILKYVVRYRDKGGVEDLRKAIHYIEKLIELEYGPQAK